MTEFPSPPGADAPEHTPGPWQFITQTDWPHTQIVHVTAPNWGVIANLRLDPGMPHLVEQQQANLRLIAAAPELLAFAREFLTDYQSEDGMATMKHYAGKAHAAIAKYLGLHQ